MFLRHLHTLPELLDIPLWRVEQLLEASLQLEKIEQANVEIALISVLSRMKL